MQRCLGGHGQEDKTSFVMSAMEQGPDNHLQASEKASPTGQAEELSRVIKGANLE